MPMRIVLATTPTSYGLGPFHPAIQNGRDVKYWPNITFATEEEAYTWADKALEPIRRYAEGIAAEWNICSVEG